MAGKVESLSQPTDEKRANVKRAKILTWFVGTACIGIILGLVARLGMQLVIPHPPPRLQLVKDIPLPSALPDVYRTSTHPLAPGLAVLFDHFDFQSLDPNTHLLFIAHTGPSPDREKQVNPRFDPGTDIKTDGNIIVFDTLQQKVVGLLNIPQVAGIIVAPDLKKVYAADAYDAIIYAINEQTFEAIPIQLQTNDGPDDMEYDPTDHLIFVSNPGKPAHPDQSQVINRKNQNETVIDALTDKVIKRISLGIDGKWGDNVGHVRFDPTLHRIFVVVQQLPDPDDPNPNSLPPPGTARLVAIDPVTLRVITRLTLPNFCFTPHGLTIDPLEHIAFIACVDADPPSILRVDLPAMKIIVEPPWPVQVKPDILAFDRPLQVLYVGSPAGISVFKEDERQLKWLGNYSYGVNNHTVAVNEVTHEVYLPVPRLGNRPVLRIMQYTEAD